MAQEKAPAFQFYPKDFLTDERVGLMSHAERGIYITLLSMCWLEHSLPADPSALAKLMSVPIPRFTRLWKGVLSQCFREEAGRLYHKRLDTERDKQVAHRQRQRDAAALRWHPHGNATALPNACFSSSSSSSSSESTTYFCASFDAFWDAYPRKVGRKPALDLWLRMKPDEQLAQEMLAGLERLKHSAQWQKDGGEFIPHPKTFLFQRRWTDEVAPVVNPRALTHHAWDCPHEPMCLARHACAIKTALSETKT